MFLGSFSVTIGIFTNIIYIYISLYGKKLNCGPELLGWLRGKESTCNAGDTGLIPGSGKSPGDENGNPLQFLPGKSHGQRNLVGYSPGVFRVRTEQLNNKTVALAFPGVMRPYRIGIYERGFGESK